MEKGCFIPNIYSRTGMLYNLPVSKDPLFLKEEDFMFSTILAYITALAVLTGAGSVPAVPETAYHTSSVTSWR